MKCHNCGKKVPDNAERCKHCEANLRDMPEVTDEEKAAVAEAIEKVMPGGLDLLGKMAADFDTAEDFANAIFVGECPKCGSEEVGTFEDVPGIEDPTAARCFDCGHIWCSGCLHPIADPKVPCGHWTICEECGKDENCPHLCNEMDCPRIKAWIAKQGK